MYLVELLGFAIVRLEILISERPSRGSPAVMFDLPEILLAQAKQCRAVHLGIAAYPIVDPGVERVAILAVPGLFRLIPCIDEDGGRIPIFSFTWQKVTAFQEQDPLTARRKSMGEGDSPRTGANDDDVVTLAGHNAPSRLSSAGRESWKQRHAAIDEQRGTDHVVRLVGGEPNGGFGDVIRLSDAAFGHQPHQCIV